MGFKFGIEDIVTVAHLRLAYKLWKQPLKIASLVFSLMYN